MERVLKRLDSIHQKLLSTIAPLAPSVYSQRPSADEWSVAEIVHHLCLVEERIIQELKSAIAREPRRVAFFRRFIPTSIFSLRLVRVKSPKRVTPLDAPTLEVALQNFEQVRNSLKTLCAEHGTERFRNIVFKNFLVGEIDGVATVSFVGYHEKRHYKQIREVLRKLGKQSQKLGK
ncbi:MAG TPA: DinB family protein [Pyrinomonadaceae bacterium]|jgi:uncharacterized damage-inducible protein DinB|nr:DinB family protein [Pyrinomonadaceae bacterium]